MTPKDKHTEVAWQAKQREVKTGSVEKTVHSATSAIYTASVSYTHLTLPTILQV